MKKGFNLIELMVVIAIIAILASIALPMYSGYKRRTAVNNCLKGISQTLQTIQAHITAIYDKGTPATDLANGITLNADGEMTGTITRGATVATAELGQIGICGDVDAGAIVTASDAANGAVTIRVPHAALTGAGCGASLDCGFAYCVVCPVSASGNPICHTVVEAIDTTDPYTINAVSRNTATITTCP